MTMKVQREKIKIIYFIFYFVLLTGLQACTTPEMRREPFDPYKGQIVLFFSMHNKASSDVAFELLAVNIISKDGTVREILDTPVSISSVTAAGRQILLGERSLPEGKYEKLQIIVKEASIRRDDRIARLALPADATEIAIEVSVKAGQSASLFLDWNADASIVDGYLFNPVFTVKGQVPELGTLLVYVTNENSNNVSVINRQTGEVVATVMVGSMPKGIAAGKRREHLKVYVANSGNDSISVIDPTINKVENEIPIRFGSQPEGIAVARISPDKELIFVTNYQTNSVSVVDGTTYQELEKIDVGNGPVAVALDPPVEGLIGAKFLSIEDANILRNYRESFFNVYIANMNSNSISVIRFNTLKNRSEEVVNIAVEWRPEALAVDYQRGRVYVANYGSDKLSVVNIMQIIKGNSAGAVSDITDAGAYITDVIADPTLDRIYLLKERPGEITIIRPSVEGARAFKSAITPILGTIAVGISPRSFILDPEGRKFYVVNRGSDNVTVIDKTTRREERIIPVGKSPYGITMFLN